MADHYQLLVIGAGPGGYVAALKAAQLGARVAVVEKHHLGGTCLNYGCIPSKALLSSAEMLHSVKHADKWGVKVGGDVGFDWSAITAHKDKTIRQLRGGIASLFKGRAVTQLAGKARFEGPGRVVVTARRRRRTTRHRRQSHHRHRLRADANPRLARRSGDRLHLGRSGSLDRLAEEAAHRRRRRDRLRICLHDAIVRRRSDDRRTDAANSADARRGPRRRTAQVFQAARHRLPSRHQSRRNANCRRRPSPRGCRPASRSTFDRVLVATGRRPNTGELGLDRAGIRTDRRGFVEVNDRLETNVAGHYTIGDANGRSMLAHAASAQGVAAAENALGHAKPFDAAIPSAVYTFPEVAAVGMTEQEARDADLPIAIGRFPIGHLGKAMAARHQEGFAKMIRHRETNELLGAHLIGHNATECIAAATALIQQKVVAARRRPKRCGHIRRSAKSIKEAAEDALGVGLHLPPRKVLRVAAAMA